MGKDKMRILIGNFIKIFDIKYINKFIHMPEYLPTLSTTIYLTHIFRRAHMYTLKFPHICASKHIP